MKGFLKPKPLWHQIDQAIGASHRPQELPKKRWAFQVVRPSPGYKNIIKLAEDDRRSRDLRFNILVLAVVSGTTNAVASQRPCRQTLWRRCTYPWWPMRINAAPLYWQAWRNLKTSCPWLNNLCCELSWICCWPERIWDCFGLAHGFHILAYWPKQPNNTTSWSRVAVSFHCWSDLQLELDVFSRGFRILRVLVLWGSFMLPKFDHVDFDTAGAVQLAATP